MRLTETKDYKVTCNLGSPIQTGWVVTNLEVAMNSFEEIFRIIDWKLAEWPDPLRPEIVSLHRGKIATGWRSRMAFATIGSAAIELVENLADPFPKKWTVKMLVKKSPLEVEFRYF